MRPLTRQLMISLDRKILDPHSASARRMIEYGKEHELYILIPGTTETERALSDTVRVYATGGNKLQQYFRLKKMGLGLMKKHNIQFVTVQDPSFIGNVGRWLKKKTGAMLEVQLHGDFYGSEFYRRTLKDRLGYQWFGKRNLRAADRVRVVGERIKKTVLALGIDERKIVVQPVALPPDTGQRTAVSQEFPGYEKYFLFQGRLEEVKGIIWLLGIWEQVIKKCGRNFLLVVVGEGSQKNNMRDQLARLQLEKYIKLKGHSSNPYQYYDSVDAVLFPSRSEGYGLVPMEAAQVGTKVIMTDVGVANFELPPSPQVRIVPVGDAEKFIKEILAV